jgi:hypothetical protein
MASTSRARVRQPDWSHYAEDTKAALAWLRQHPADGRGHRHEQSGVYLRTGTPTIQLKGLIDRPS